MNHLAEKRPIEVFPRTFFDVLRKIIGLLKKLEKFFDEKKGFRNLRAYFNNVTIYLT